MKLYLDQMLLGDITGPKKKRGEFFPRLVGFAVRSEDVVSSDGNWSRIIPLAEIEPVYVPLLRFSARAGQVFIEVNNRELPQAYITLQLRRPFVHVFRFDWNPNEGE